MFVVLWGLAMVIEAQKKVMKHNFMLLDMGKQS